MNQATPGVCPDKILGLPSWCSGHPHMKPWDDGFLPSGAESSAKGWMIVDQPRASRGLFRVTEDAISEDLAAKLYSSAVEVRVWGVYILKSEIFDKSLTEFPPTKEDHERHTLALHTIREFLVQSSPLLPQDWEQTHGVVVWVITSDTNDVVAYHMDYAEMFRYQTNVVYPPMYSGTLHVTRFRDEKERNAMQGGDFYAYECGLDHYKVHGYKAMLKPISEEGQRVVTYKYRRGILVDGNFPHGSTPVTALPPSTKRVVVGLNVFNHEIGPHAQAYPEHSQKFNKYVKVAQAAAASTKDVVLSIDTIRKNPKQAALLRFLLRKAKEKQLV
ncbi:hypothetical protein LEN26_000633 [Aphanomyces euteiches]|nr:hypothetical protein AeMF1_002576 [Aphanomyces euteiches]KAH9163140.1 hypothetical protein LEN26_000633 [Aphanomyces euteiches]KAH9191020.1 hypothetical protein AeNC1_006999 [Aphanomyces euteiches]